MPVDAVPRLPSGPASLLAETTKFMRARAAYHDRLLGRRFRPSSLRETLLQEVLLNCSCGQAKALSHYVQMVKPHASRSTVVAELQLLSECGVVILRKRNRQTLVFASQKAVDFTASNLTGLLHDFAERLRPILAESRQEG